MGNKLNLELKEGCGLDINDKLIKDFQDRIYMMDKSMASFAHAVDTMEVTCVNLLRHIHSRSNDEDSRSREDNLLDDTTLAEAIKECVKDHKFIVLESASKLLHSIIDIGKTYVEFNTELAIDKYRLKHNVTEIPYYDQRFKELHTKVQLLRQEYQSQKKLVDIFNHREELYAEEKEETKTEIAKLKSEKEQLTNTLKTNQIENEAQNTKMSHTDKQNKKLKEENTEMHKVVVELKSKIKSFSDEIQSLIEENTSINVQVTGYLEKKQEALKHDDLHCETMSQDESHLSLIKDMRCLRDSLDVQMEKMRNQLILVKKYFETERNLGIQGIQREYQASIESKHQVSHLENEVLQEVSVKTNTRNNEIEKLNLIIDEMKKKQHQLTSENKELQHKLKTMQKKKTAQVQVYYEIGVKIGAKERDVINVLKFMMKKERIDLQVAELLTPQHVQVDIPLLIIRICNYGYDGMFQSPEYWHVLEEFADIQTMAVLTLHCKHEVDVEKDTVYGKEIKERCARRFDIGYKRLSKRFDFSERKIRPIIEFITGEGSRYHAVE